MRVPVDADGLFCIEPSDQDYLVMPELRNLRAVSLIQGSELTAAAVTALEELPRLEELLLGMDNLGDESLGRLSGLVKLKTLHIPRSKVSDVGVEIIVHLFPDLEELGLCFTAAKDSGLSHLSRLRNLKTLLLCGEGFTSDALEVLSSLHSLTLIKLINTAIDIDAARRFARQRPRVEVRWGLPALHSEPIILK